MDTFQKHLHLPVTKIDGGPRLLNLLKVRISFSHGPLSLLSSYSLEWLLRLHHQTLDIRMPNIKTKLWNGELNNKIYGRRDGPQYQEWWLVCLQCYCNQQLGVGSIFNGKILVHYKAEMRVQPDCTRNAPEYDGLARIGLNLGSISCNTSFLQSCRSVELTNLLKIQIWVQSLVRLVRSLAWGASSDGRLFFFKFCLMFCFLLKRACPLSL